MFHLLLWLLSECLLMANREIVTDFLHAVLSVYVMVFFTPAFTTLYALQFDLPFGFVSAVCKIPSILKNGAISTVNFDNEGIIELSCHHGYKLSGSRVLQCVSGQWNDSIPQCLKGKIATLFGQKINNKNNII